MIRLPKFDFVAPTSLSEALNVLAQGNGNTKLLAGGTDLVVGMKQGISQPKQVVWLGKLKELQNISFYTDEGMRIGAMCTLSEIERNENVRRYYPSLVQAARSIASPQIRNRATIGGNLCLNTRCFYYDQSEFWRNSLGYCLKYGDGICHAAPELSRCTAVLCCDLAPLLIALNATVELCSAASQQQLLLSKFYNNDGKRHLTVAPSDILASINIPYDPQLKSVHGKIRSRASIDFAIANTGIAIKINNYGECEQARIIVGAVSSSPFDAKEPAQKLLGQQLTDEKIAAVAQEVAAIIKPMPNIDGAISYRKKMVSILVERTLHTALGNSVYP